MDLIKCLRCETLYKWTKSTSSLKLTYCTSLCERGDLGFNLEALEKNVITLVPKQEKVEENEEPEEGEMELVTA